VDEARLQSGALRVPRPDGGYGLGMTQPTTPHDAGPPDERRDDPPQPGAAWVQEHQPPDTEAERQAQETIRSVSRLEESN
jgi:hypothetical protein